MDFYKLLGVAKDATPEQIKKAFREKVKKYHPDLNKENEEIFKLLNQAYTTLIDPQKRAIYDKEIKKGLFSIFQEKLAEFLGFTVKPQNGTDIKKILYISLKEGYNGTIRKIEYKRKVICHICNGTGITKDSKIEKCEKCGGTGKRNILPCLNCFGRGFIIKNPCKDCKGLGYKYEKTEKLIKIDKGIDENTTILIKGAGNQGLYGGKDGDLYLKIKFEKDIYQKVGNDLYLDIKIKNQDLKSISHFSIKNLKDETIFVKIPENIEKNTILRIKGEGYIDSSGNKGDILIRLDIV